MPIYKITDESIEKAAEEIRNGGLAAFPTETVYGLGGDAYNSAAAANIFEVKNRPQFDPLIVHIAEIETLEKITDFSLLDKTAKKNLEVLTKNLWPGPLTLILPKKPVIPEIVTSGMPTAAIRFPSHETAQKIIKKSTGAVAAPSANPFGYLSPTRAEHVFEMLGNKIEIILDGGSSELGLESTVLDLCNGQPRILRPGGTSKEAIEALIGSIALGSNLNENTGNKALVSPGLLKSHYAPKVKLSVHTGEDLCSMFINDEAAILFFDEKSHDKWLSAKKTEVKPIIKILSKKGNLLEAATQLFKFLHELDHLEIKHIYAQFVPEEGLGLAINDRLKKASNK